MPIDPRAQWPTESDVARGNIPPAERMLEGRALARLTDLGSGGTLRSLFAVDAKDAPASPAMLAACVRVLADWGWAERPVGVVAMPSSRHPQLTDSVSHGLAAAGKLPYFGALDYAAEPQGGLGGNSASRLAQVFDAFEIPGEVEGTIQLVDDLAHSRWTLTVAAWLLRRTGTDQVLAFAVAQQG